MAFPSFQAPPPIIMTLTQAKTYAIASDFMNVPDERIKELKDAFGIVDGVKIGVHSCTPERVIFKLMIPPIPETIGKYEGRFFLPGAIAYLATLVPLDLAGAFRLVKEETTHDSDTYYTFESSRVVYQVKMQSMSNPRDVEFLCWLRFEDTPGCYRD